MPPNLSTQMRQSLHSFRLPSVPNYLTTDKTQTQEVAEATVQDFKNDRGPFVVAAETTRMAMVFTNATPSHPIIFANDSFLELTGYAREDVLGLDFKSLLANVDDLAGIALINQAFGDQEQHPTKDVHCRRHDGSEFWAAVFVSPVRDEQGDIVQYFASLVDLTSHREHEEQQGMLIDELNHRVKNTLATVQSIVWQALRNDSDPKRLGENIQSRLMALSRSHDLLTRENWKSADLGDIITDALQPFRNSDNMGDRIVVTGPKLRFPPRQALALAIAFNELATNATKYGSLSSSGGSVSVEWHLEPGAATQNFVLVWRERGGPLVAGPSRKGFGSRMIERGLAVELNGQVKIEYLPEGVVCTISAAAP